MIHSLEILIHFEMFCELFENKQKPTGILCMVDDELRMPKATDATLLSRMHQTHEKNKYYVKPKMAKPIFSVNHYAGEV